MVAVNRLANSTIAELREEFERLGQFRQQLASRLADSADQLEFPGLPPSAALIDDLVTYRRRIQFLAETLGADAGVASISLNDLYQLIERNDYRLAAQQANEQLANLSHVDVPDFAPLVLCQHEARRLCELATEFRGLERNPELELLRQRRHPLNALIRLCLEGTQLSDTDWTECHDSVATTYGRQLATALTRGRIQSTTMPPPVVPVAPIQPSVPIAIPVPAPTIVPEPVDTVFEPASASETIFDVTPPSQTAAARLRMAAIPLDIADRKPVVRDVPIVKSTVVSVVAPPEKTAAKDEFVPRPEPVLPANSKLESLGTDIPEIVNHLLTEGRLPLALQFTRCLERRKAPSEIMPPSWLIRALILGRHLSYSKGEIARQLDEELREFRPDMLLEGDEDRQLALSFLLRAAALPAALLAGSGPAAAILRTFKIAPGFSQLYNYCNRIALYGDRLSGNLVELFRPAGTIAGASELQELSESAKSWLQETARNVVSYMRTSPLFLHAHWTLSAGTAVRHADTTYVWCKWQETLSLVQKLLKPVCDQTDGDRNWVRQEIGRLSTQVRVEPISSANRGLAQGTINRGIALPLEEMHAVIQEAVAIANRWLRLCHQTASPGGAPIPMEALELRDEILKRSEGVLCELSQHRKMTSSSLVQAATACCQSSVRQVHALFESRLSLPLVEPDPRHVLNADLLRVPGLELNEQWVPENEPAVVERELLANLERGELSWRQSFDYHAHTGNHEATGRLLDLDVWVSDEERDALKSLRQSQIAECRTVANSELEEAAADFATITEAGTWSDSDCAAMHKRLERLWNELPRVVNFSSFRRQINQLQSAMLRQRACSGLPPGLLAVPALEVAEPVRKELVGRHEPVAQSFDIFSGE